MASGTLFDVQHFAVHDGPGIRTLAFLKGCPLRCAWCCNPESQSSAVELRHARARCRGCHRCVEACPAHAIRVAEQPTDLHIDREACRTCMARPCVAACPEDALRLVGQRWSVSELVERVAKDLAFYRNSGGGVTFSGGEPLAQAGFLAEALAACRAKGIHTAVETCGHAPTSTLDAIAPLVDLFLFDIKAVEPATHRVLTGQDNALVLANLRRLAAERDEQGLELRFPLVPGYTDEEDNLAAIASQARVLGLRRITVQRYHALGATKYEDLGRPRLPARLQAPDERPSLDRLTRIFAHSGLGWELG